MTTTLSEMESGFLDEMAAGLEYAGLGGGDPGHFG
jgi:hypothetical protein